MLNSPQFFFLLFPLFCSPGVASALKKKRKREKNKNKRKQKEKRGIFVIVETIDLMQILSLAVSDGFMGYSSRLR